MAKRRGEPGVLSPFGRCVICGETFERVARGSSRLRVYCSVACRQKAYRERCKAKPKKPPLQVRTETDDTRRVDMLGALRRFSNGDAE